MRTSGKFVHLYEIKVLQFFVRNGKEITFVVGVPPVSYTHLLRICCRSHNPYSLMLSRGMLPMKQEIISLSFSYAFLFFGWLFCQKLARKMCIRDRSHSVDHGCIVRGFAGLQLGEHVTCSFYGTGKELHEEEHVLSLIHI